MPRRHLLRLLVGAIVLSLVLYAFKSRGPEISLSFDGGPLSHAEDDSCRPSDDCNKPHLQEPVEPPLTHTSLPIEVPAQELLPHKDSTAASTAQEKPSSTYKVWFKLNWMTLFETNPTPGFPYLSSSARRAGNIPTCAPLHKLDPCRCHCKDSLRGSQLVLQLGICARLSQHQQASLHDR